MVTNENDLDFPILIQIIEYLCNKYFICFIVFNTPIRVIRITIH